MGRYQTQALKEIGLSVCSGMEKKNSENIAERVVRKNNPATILLSVIKE